MEWGAPHAETGLEGAVSLEGDWRVWGFKYTSKQRSKPRVRKPRCEIFAPCLLIRKTRSGARGGINGVAFPGALELPDATRGLLTLN